MMQNNGSRACVPEVITLSDSDDEVLIALTNSAATCSVFILHERPLSPSAFLALPIPHAPLTNSTLSVNFDELHLVSNEDTCLECNEIVQDMVDHTRSSRVCSKCNYKSACDEAFLHHKGVKCNVHRAGIDRSRLLRMYVECAGCGLKSADAQTMVPHLLQCSGGKAIIRQREQGPIDEADSAKERVEAECFGLCHRKKKQDKSEAVTEKMDDREREASAVMKKSSELLQDDFDDWRLEEDVDIDTESLAARLEDILEMLGDAFWTGTETWS